MAEPLALQSVIGFGGAVENGLIAHPDGRTIIYPLGSTIVLRDKFDSRAQEFLQGHSDKVLRPHACMQLCSNSVPRCPRCCWTAQQPVHPHHDTMQVSAVALSKSGKYLATGQVTYMGFTADIIIWDLENRQLMHRMALHKVGARAGARRARARAAAAAHMRAPGAPAAAGQGAGAGLLVRRQLPSIAGRAR